MYNMKVYEYVDGYQVRYYGKPVMKKCEYDTDDDLKADEKSVMSEEERQLHSITVSMNRTKNQIYGIARANEWDLFSTLTFDRNKVNSSHYGTVSVKARNWLSNIKIRYCPDLKYLAVPELHADGEHWHVHILLSGVDGLPLVDSGIMHKGKKIYNLPGWKYGFSTASFVEDNNAVALYVCKYITKELCTLTQHRRRYWASNNCKRMDDVSSEFLTEEEASFYQLYGQSIDYVKGVRTPRGLIKYIEVDKGVFHDVPDV